MASFGIPDPPRGDVIGIPASLKRKADHPMRATGKPIKRLKAGWRDVLLVCRRCSRRLDGGFGPGEEQKLAKALKGELGQQGKKKAKSRHVRVAVLEVGCFDICPKGGVVVARAGQPGHWLVVPAGTPPGEVLRALGIEGPES